MLAEDSAHPRLLSESIVTSTSPNAVYNTNVNSSSIFSYSSSASSSPGFGIKSEMSTSKDFEKIYAVLMDKDNLSVDHSLVLYYLSDQGVESFEDLDLEDRRFFLAQFDQLISYMKNVPQKKILKWLNRL